MPRGRLFGRAVKSETMNRTKAATALATIVALPTTATAHADAARVVLGWEESTGRKAERMAAPARAEEKAPANAEAGEAEKT